MKLRFHAGTLRLRLSQSEVARLADGGRVEETVTFAPEQVFSYALETGAATAVTASLGENRIRVAIPAARAASWAGSDEIRIEESGGHLRILIEKDFLCAHPESEEDWDAFPNPQAR
jgi:hypothetical protein